MRDDCKECEGSGHAFDDNISDIVCCSHCNGSGEEPCFYCLGSGMEGDGTNRPCSVCNGK